jgi:hypothetical protein
MAIGPIYIGTTTIDTLGELKVGNTNVSKVYVGDIQVFPSIVSFSGNFTLANDAGSAANFRAQDGSITSGHFTTTAYLTPGTSATPTVSGTLPPDNPFRITVNSTGNLTKPIIISQGISATSASVSSYYSGNVLYVKVTPNSYSSSVILSGTLTVTSVPPTPTPYTVTFRGKNELDPIPNVSASIQYSTSSTTGPWTTVSTPIKTSGCTTLGTATILGGSTLYVQVIESSSLSTSGSIIRIGASNGACPDAGYICGTSYIITGSQYVSVTTNLITNNGQATSYYYCSGYNQ